MTIVAMPLLFLPPLLGRGVFWIRPIRTATTWPLIILGSIFMILYGGAAWTAFWTTRDVCDACPSKTLVVLGSTCYDCINHVQGDSALCPGTGNVTVSALEQRFRFYEVAQGLDIAQM